MPRCYCYGGDVPAVTCKDCLQEGITRHRPTPHGGPQSPLCVSHHRARKRRRSDRAHELRTQSTYGLSRNDYLALLEHQGGRCFICQRANGTAKRLAVDHEHYRDGCEHDPETGCRRCVRALLCGPCNQLVGRYNATALLRAFAVLTDPPARVVLGVE